MSRTALLAGLAAGALLASLSACAVGPNFQTPAPPAVTSLTPQPLPAETAAAAGPAGASQRFVQGAVLPGDWWTLFGSPKLDALVQQALKANPDLEAAKAALRQAKEAEAAQRGALFPTVDAGANTTRAKNSNTVAPVLADNNNLYSLQTAQLNIGYVPDLFGGIRRATEQAAAQAEQQRFQTEAAYQSLAANVVVAAIQLAALRDQTDALRAVVALNEEQLDILHKQQGLGQAGHADVAAQEQALAQARQALAPVEKQLAQQADLMADLLGRYPGQGETDAPALASLTLPRDLPLSLPSDLVKQRPDIRAAEANVHAASAGVGVAIANRLPTITLAANAGGAATSWSQLLSNGNDFWTLSAGVAQPIFQGGALLHRQRGAEAALDQAKAQYRSAVLGAFQNVADALQALEVDARTLQAAAAAEHGAAQALAIVRQQQTLGQSGRLDVIGAEQTWRQAQVALVQAEAARFSDTAGLIQALGGGWWNRKGG